MNRLLSRIFAERRQTGRLDLEAVEMALRAGLHQAGAAALSALLHYDPPAPAQRTRPCACGHPARYVALRSKTVLTAVGAVALRRPYFRCAHCGAGQFPVDAELDVAQTRKSPGVRRMLGLVGHTAPFAQGHRQLKRLAGLEVTAKEVERTAEALGADIAAREQAEIQRAMQLELPRVGGPGIPILYVQIDATGVPVVKAETVGRLGKTPGHPAHTREAKLGCVFTQTTWDTKGYPIRDPESTTYTGAIEPAEAFGKRIFLETWKRGWSRAAKKVVMGDGAEWIWNLAQEHFPDALQIVDLYHARQHLWEVARALFPTQEAEQRRWRMAQQHQLDEGRIEKLVRSLRSIAVS
ncbi:MAG TPA: ISKra4 family transposase, partial [bacterium]|nr:ISKra4 family transposase [bacterium]